MAILGVVVGVWFAAMGAYGVTHPVRPDAGGAAHWTSTPSGRRVGGTLAVAVGLALAVASIALI